MMKKGSTSSQTRNNWLIDALVFSGALIASISGIYFLFLPVGGYQGGRNPLYGVTVLFERSRWDDLHMWSGIVMISAAVVHIVLHWRWITGMTVRMAKDIFRPNTHLNNRSRFNVGINATIGVSFLAAAFSGATGKPSWPPPLPAELAIRKTNPPAAFSIPCRSPFSIEPSGDIASSMLMGCIR